MKLLKTLGWILLSILFVALVFALVTLIVSGINNVTFYEQLKIWFGPGTLTEKLLSKI